MTEKFTPGEWAAHLGIMEPTFVHIGKEENYIDGETPVICELHHGIKKRHPSNGEFDFDCSEMQANAHLIATAPKLYQMLKLARYEFEIIANWCEENGMEDDAQSYNNLAAGILNVLQQARGEV